MTINRRLLAIIRKEFIQIIRDPSSILISVLLPLILLFIYGVGVSLDADKIKIGLVLEDTSPLAQSFAKSLTNSRYFSVKIARDRRVFDNEILHGSIRGIVVIPSYFSKFKKDKNHIAPIQVIADGSEPNTSNFVQNYVQAAHSNWLEQEAITQGKANKQFASIASRFWYNEELESRNFLIPGSLAIIMTLTGTLLTALVVSREWERGTMEALLATPIRISEFLIGKFIPYFVLAMGTMLMSVILALIIYRIPMQGSWIALIFITSMFLIPALGLGLFISTIARNQVAAAQLSMVTGFLPAFILSGFIFEIASMPLVIQFITKIIPARYFVSCLQTLFLVGDDWGIFMKNIIPMLAVGAIFLTLTAIRTKKRLE